MSTAPRPNGTVRTVRTVRAAQILIGLLLGGVLAFVGSDLYHGVANPARIAAARAERGYAIHDLGAAPSLRGFTDQLGRPFDPSTLRGKVQVVSFLDPRGTRVSPVIGVNLLMALESDLKTTGRFGKDVVFVSLNVDPQAADPATAASFLKQVVGFGTVPAPAEQWVFLGASPTHVAQVVREGYGVPYRRLGDGAFQRYAARQKAQGTYFYARAWNPLAESGLPAVVGNSTIMIVGPNGHIRARIPRAYQVSSVAVEQTIEAVLAKSGR